MSRVLASVRHRIVAFFWDDDSAVNLAVARIAVFGAVLVAAKSTAYFVAAATLPHELFRVPFGAGWLAPLVPTTPDGVLRLLWIVRIAAVLALLGVATRVSTVVAALAVLVLFVVPNCFGHVRHVHHHLAWFTAILAASRCGDALSVDAWWRRRRGHASVPRTAPCYGFPLRAMAAVLGLSYFFAGVWKVAVAGPQWLLSDNLAYLASKQAFATNGAMTTVGAAPFGAAAPAGWLEMVRAHQVIEPPAWLARIGGCFTLVFELGFVVLLPSRTGRLVAALAGVGFHNFTRVFAGIGFDELLLCYPLLVDVDGWARSLRRALGWTTAPAPAARATRPSPALVAVAAAFVVGTLVCGALRIGAAWPVSCAPRFDVVHGPLFSSYVVSGVLPDQTTIHVRDAGLGGPALGSRIRELLRGRQSHVPGLEQPDDRLRRWQVLCAWVWNHLPRLADATDVRFALVDVDLTDGSARARLIATRELFRCDRADDPDGRRR